MKLYQVTFDGDNDFIEAESFGQAVALWSAEMKRQNDNDWDDEEEPEQVVLVSDKPVICERMTIDAARQLAGLGPL